MRRVVITGIGIVSPFGRGIKANWEDGLLQSKSAIKKIKGSNADILFVGLGSPKQEQFIIENKEQLNEDFEQEPIPFLQHNMDEFEWM